MKWRSRIGCLFGQVVRILQHSRQQGMDLFWRKCREFRGNRVSQRVADVRVPNVGVNKRGGPRTRPSVPVCVRTSARRSMSPGLDLNTVQPHRPCGMSLAGFPLHSSSIPPIAPSAMKASTIGKHKMRRSRATRGRNAGFRRPPQPGGTPRGQADSGCAGWFHRLPLPRRMVIIRK